MNAEIDVERRFWARVHPDRDPERCWRWIGTIKKPDGYGAIKLDNKSYMAHRISYTLNVGPIPKGLVIDHTCNNKACVNPSHLEAVTASVNAIRRDNFRPKRARQ